MRDSGVNRDCVRQGRVDGGSISGYDLHVIQVSKILARAGSDCGIDLDGDYMTGRFHRFRDHGAVIARSATHMKDPVPLA